MKANRPELQWIQPPQQERSQKTLVRILDAAELLVAAKGFDDTSVAEVVREAGSSVGAFYSRFKDKEGLLYALYERHLEEAIATADGALDRAQWEGQPVAAIVPPIVAFLVEIYRERAGLLRTFVVRNHVDLEFRARQERLSHYVSGKLAALLLERREQIGHPDPERALALGFSMVLGSIEGAVLFGELRSSAFSLSDEDLAHELARAYLAYLDVRITPPGSSSEPAE